MPYFINDNLSLFYREKGTGELFLILPGNTASSVCHKEELDYFSENYHAVSFDFRGTGKSPRIPAWSQDWWDKCADDAASLISHLGKNRCIIMGTSGGANIALLCAIRYPEHVSGVIADSCAEIYSPANLRKEVSGRTLRTNEQVDFWKYANGEDWETVVNADNKLLHDFADQGGNLFNGRLNEIKCPVLFTGAVTDSFIPDIGEQYTAMAKQVKKNSVFLHNDGDHPFMWTCPERFRSACIHFLRAGMK